MADGLDRSFVDWFLVAGGGGRSDTRTTHVFCVYRLDFRLPLLCPEFGVPSTTYLTRLETRTKEFKVHASQ